MNIAISPTTQAFDAVAIGSRVHDFEFMKVVAVLAFGGPEASPVSPHRFVENLAGGNKEYETYSKDELVKLAHQVKDYHNEWCVVLD